MSEKMAREGCDFNEEKNIIKCIQTSYNVIDAIQKLLSRFERQLKVLYVLKQNTDWESNPQPVCSIKS